MAADIPKWFKQCGMKGFGYLLTIKNSRVKPIDGYKMSNINVL